MIKNKINIPWYKRNIRGKIVDNFENYQHGFNISKPKPNNKPNGNPTRQPSTVPITVPETETIKNPISEPTGNPFKIPLPFPIPEKTPDNEKNPFRNPFPNRYPVPSIPIQYMENIETETIKEGINWRKPIGNILKPIMMLVIGKELINNYVEVNIKNPIYNAMMQDAVLSLVLIEAEKAELDMEIVANYFANYDYDNFNINEMTLELTTLFGTATAIRLIVFFVGRKVVFRI